MKMSPNLVASVCLAVAASVSASAWAQFPTPEVTKEHKLLKRDVGAWDAEMKRWMPGSDQPVMEAQGIERNRLVSGLWLLSTFTAELGGQKFIGHGQLGYDPSKKKFVGTWIENMSTHISTMEGTYDEKTGEMTMMMKSVDPRSGKDTTSKSVSKYMGDDKRIFSMYMKVADSDEWVKSMEVAYTRRAEDKKEK